MARPERQKLKVTLDTNTLPVDQALAALGTLPADVKVTTVTAHEVQGTRWEPELASLADEPIPELEVMGESPMGGAVLGSQEDADRFERALLVISNGSFPKPGERGTLTPAQRRQMRDAMIFCTHIHQGRDVFVTEDVKAFGGEHSAQRQRIEALASGSRVMTLDEFERFCRQARA